MESIFFLLLQSSKFLAPLSDPIFGSEMVPEPKREENHGIDRVFELQFYTFLAPLSDPILAPKTMWSPNGKKIMESISFCSYNPMHF